MLFPGGAGRQDTHVNLDLKGAEQANGNWCGGYRLSCQAYTRSYRCQFLVTFLAHRCTYSIFTDGYTDAPAVQWSHTLLQSRAIWSIKLQCHFCKPLVAAVASYAATCTVACGSRRHIWSLSAWFGFRLWNEHSPLPHEGHRRHLHSHHGKKPTGLEAVRPQYRVAAFVLV